MHTISPKELKTCYENGENITQILKEVSGETKNSGRIIEVAYDLQTGSYIEAEKNAHILEHKLAYSKKLAETISSLDPSCNSLLEAGLGEATVLSKTIKHLEFEGSIFGFDISWSRVAYAKNWLKNQSIGKSTLFTGDMFYIPIADNAIDIVYTSHAIEPNGGRETQILRELFRIARNYVVLLEPGYELANQEAKARMEKHGFCKNLAGTAEALGMKVLTHELFPFAVNPLNPTALTVIEKSCSEQAPSFVLSCPQYKTPLKRLENVYFSEEALSAYPIIAEIPCLRPENAIFASKINEFLD